MDIGCPACGRTLRVADEQAGKQIRCPACQQVCTTPAGGGQDSGVGGREPGVGVSGSSLDAEEPAWHVRMPGGPIYGPVRWREIVAWAKEGRVASDCELAESPDGPWRDAPSLLPHLAVNLPHPAMAAAPATYPWATPGDTAPAAGGYVAPHRGGLILVLGLLSWIGCPLVSFAAWVMGSHDLCEMRAGRMDKSGESLTRTGMILGIIVSALWLLAGGAWAVMLLVVALFY